MLDTITLFTIVFYVSLSLPIFLVFILSKFYTEKREKLILNNFAFVYLILTFLFMAFRPIGPLGFTDTQMYIDWLNKSKADNAIETKDWGFGILMWISAKIFPIRLFFVICTLISFATLFWISKQINKRYWFLFFLGTMISLYFWNQQVFTLRQGMASLIFLAAFFQKKMFLRILLFLIAVSFHKSFALPLLCYLIVLCYNKTTFYLLLWLLSIPVSYFFGNDLGKSMSSLFPEDIKYYYVEKSSSDLHFFGFRWDVILYSLIFVILPYYYRSKDKKYVTIYNLYLLSNIFTILVIWPTSNFIHRFAYLSWFLTPLLLYYPLLSNRNDINLKSYLRILVTFYILILLYFGIKLKGKNFRLIDNTPVNTIRTK